MGFSGIQSKVEQEFLMDLFFRHMAASFAFNEVSDGVLGSFCSPFCSPFRSPFYFAFLSEKLFAC